MNEFFERISNLSQKRLVLLAVELQARLESLEKGAASPAAGANPAIAIIGMACRYPGGANSPEAFWQLLQEGRDAISEIPAGRWDTSGLYDPDPEAAGKMATRWGGFIDAVDQFDPQLFGITPREAQSMDPQQRLMLEVSWEALERAGYAPDRLQGSPTGVFVGACNGDYYHMLLADGLENVDMYLATGNAHSVISGRVSYTFGLQGPSISVDTACSSSLVAIHYAVRSLRSGECRMALAGGVNALLSPDVTITLSRAKMMAADGRCKAFDAAADGFVRSEGCGVVVLKRLEDAQADGDNILAVIRGSAINQDGRSNGLTAPNGPSQVAVMRAALADAGLEAGDIGYVETHGTGTSLGDPIEAQALGAALGAGHSKEKPLLIGSVKTNLGHLEAAAGVAGLSKLVLALKEAEIPPHLHLKELSPHIPWQELPIIIPTARTPWPGRRIGGISSFGFSGTNVHIILEAAPAGEERQPATAGRPAQLLTLSARSESALRTLAARHAEALSAGPAVRFDDYAYTANTGRAHLGQRLALVAATPEEAGRKLAAFVAEAHSDETLHAPATARPAVAFLFTGHGGQYPGMGRGLYASEPVFRQAIERCAEILRPSLETSLLEVLYPGPGQTAEAGTSSTGGQPSLLDTMAYAQPANFAVEYALAELWRSWGVLPAAVLGHSLGEYAAAVVAGVMSLEDGLKLVARRGRLMDSLPQSGSMAAVFTTEEEVAEVLRPYAGQVSIAVINGPTSIVISGTSQGVDAALAAFNARQIKGRKLAVAQAAHSPLIDPMLDEFEALAATVAFSAPRLELISCTTGRPARAEEVTPPGYWRRHLRQPVQFARAMETLRDEGYTLFLEVGPNPMMISMGQRLLPGGYGAWAASLREQNDDYSQILTALGTLFVHGVEIRWDQVYGEGHPTRQVLPTYPFDHQRYWLPAEGKRPGAEHPRPQVGGHALLGARLESPALQGIVYESELNAFWPPYLDHHRIYGTAILPSPGYIEMALRAAEAAFGPGAYQISNLTIQEALLLPEEGLRKVQFLFEGQALPAAFRVVGRDDAGEWKTHATGRVEKYSPAEGATPRRQLEARTAILERCRESISGEDYYARLQALGLEFGEGFRGLREVWRRDGEALGRVQIPAALETAGYHVHPAFLDACFHLVGAPLPGGQFETAYLLIGIEHFCLHRPLPATVWNHTTITEHAGETFSGDVHLYDEDGSLVAEVSGLQLKRASRAALLRAVRPPFDGWFYQVEWPSRPLAANTLQAGAWLLLGGGELAAQFAAALQPHGQACRLIEDPQLPANLQPWLEPIDGRVIQGIVDLRALSMPPVDEDGSGEEVYRRTATGVQALLHLAQALLPLGTAAPKVWIATRAGQAVTSGEASDPASAALWGFGRVLALEHPELWGGLIDVDTATPEALLAEMLHSDGEDQVAYRHGERHVARLQRLPRPPALPTPIRPQASYLVSGGLGGLGLQIARWLAEGGAGCIVLVGRHAPSAQAEATLRQIASRGTQVAIETADVGDFEQMRTLFASFGTTRPPLGGIFHAAAALSHHPISELDSQAVEAMLWPKTAGTWNLHRLSRDLALDFFVLFSSTTALWGSSQLAHYAAANQFLDAFAHYRHALGLPALSLNWGTWDAMRVASAAEQQRTAQFGLEQMPSEAALGILGELLGTSRPQITVAAVDWEALKPAYEARRARPFLSQVENKKARRPLTPQPEAAAERPQTLGEQLRSLGAEDRHSQLIAHVQRLAARVIGTPDPAGIDIHQGLFEMGLDSLMSVELKGRLEASVGQPLPSTLTFNYPTIAELAAYLESRVFTTAEDAPATGGEVQPPAEAGGSPATAAEDLSEDDLAALLADRLSKME